MFPIRLKELREGSGYRSQQSFADAFGVAQSTVGNWEAGKREPNYETTVRLADFFGVSVDYLIGHSAETVGSRIRAEREAKGISLDELASLSGIKKQTVIKYESGRLSVAPLSHLESIAAVLNVPPTYLENGIEPILPDGDPFENLYALDEDEEALIRRYRALPASQKKSLDFIGYSDLTAENQAKALEYIELLLNAQRNG